jgi:peptidoglycan hydrolase-like protein with peptidoglycan-binding domain
VTCSSTAYDSQDGSLAAASAISSSSVLGASISTTCTDLPYNFHRGNESLSTSKLQGFLMASGYLDETTGFYGDKTVAAVKAYQKSQGLPMTGMVYGATRAAIKAETCQ